MYYKKLIERLVVVPYIMYPNIGSILVAKKAKLCNPCYHESEEFFQNHESSGFQDLSAICHHGPPSYNLK
jgi:hypothetical protein